MYRDNTTDKKYPKTLLIRNTYGGMIWQVYHVQKESEAAKLSKNAAGNGFMDRELVDHTGEEETFPNWRDNAPGIVETIEVEATTEEE